MKRLAPVLPAGVFGKRSSVYESYRPGYPKAILSYLRAMKSLTKTSIVADIGSGTGKFTKLLLENNNYVFAVEPDSKMRRVAEKLYGGHSQFYSVAGAAENTKLLDHTIDTIVVAQAFHWFNPNAARKEFIRILAPMGTVVLIWNLRRVVGSPFQIELERVLRTHIADYQPVHRWDANFRIRYHCFFSPKSYSETMMPNEQSLTPEGLMGRIMSASFAPPQGSSKAERLSIALNELHYKYARKGLVSLEYDLLLVHGHIADSN